MAEDDPGLPVGPTAGDDGAADLALMVRRDLFVDGADYSSFVEAVIACADVGLVVVDAHGNFLILNPSVRRMMALAFPEGHHGAPGEVGAVFAADGVTVLRSEQLPSTRATRGEEFDDYRIWVGSDPGTRLALSATARRLRDAAGATVGTVVVVRDITDMVRALQVREDFLATVSHEIRTPLTSVLGYLEIAREQLSGARESVGRQLAIAQRNGERLLRLVDDLLLAARLGREVTLATSSTDLRELVEDAVESARPAARRAGVELEAVTEPVPPLSVDRDRMSEVLDNLLANALKFTPSPGSVSVAIVATEHEVVITVRDSGIGIGAHDEAMIFDRFFRSSQAQVGAFPGMGLGLYVVKRLVEAHGGEVRAHSNEGSVGMAVVVRLPLGTT